MLMILLILYLHRTLQKLKEAGRLGARGPLPQRKGP